MASDAPEASNLFPRKDLVLAANSLDVSSGVHRGAGGNMDEKPDPKPDPNILAYEQALLLIPEGGRTPSVRAGLLVQVICQRNPSLAGKALLQVLAEDAPAQLAGAIRTDAALRLQLLRVLDSSKKWETIAMALGAWHRAKEILPEFAADKQGPGTAPSSHKRRIYRSTGDVVEEIRKRL